VSSKVTTLSPSPSSLLRQPDPDVRQRSYAAFLDDLRKAGQLADALD